VFCVSANSHGADVIVPVVRTVKIILISIAVSFGSIQLLRIDRSNPPIAPGKTLESVVNVPADIQQVFAKSCNDCHSHKTVYPWYTQVAPVSWWLRDHIDHGRENLNFSEFATQPTRNQERSLEAICDEVRSGQMPLPSYLIMHTDALLSESDKNAICAWTDAERAKFQNGLGKNDILP
jgi:hypothetical protein